MRNDSIFTRRIIGDSSAAEVPICYGGPDNMYILTNYINPSQVFFTDKNRNPAVARHRSEPVDMIVWDRVDSGFTIGTKSISEIMAAVIDDNDSIISTSSANPAADSGLRGSYIRVSGEWSQTLSGAAIIDTTGTRTTGSLSFLATPSITGLDSGWAVAWADSAEGIWMSVRG